MPGKKCECRNMQTDYTENCDEGMAEKMGDMHYWPPDLSADTSSGEESEDAHREISWGELCTHVVE